MPKPVRRLTMATAKSTLLLSFCLAGIGALAVSSELVASKASKVPNHCLDAMGAVIPESVTFNLGEKGRKKQVLTRPKRIYAPEPIWPKDAVCRISSRDFRFHFIIRNDGYVCGGEALSRIPDSCQKHVDAILYRISAWRFEPAKVDGTPVAVHYFFKIRFR